MLFPETTFTSFLRIPWWKGVYIMEFDPSTAQLVHEVHGLHKGEQVAEALANVTEGQSYHCPTVTF